MRSHLSIPNHSGPYSATHGHKWIYPTIPGYTSPYSNTLNTVPRSAIRGHIQPYSTYSDIIVSIWLYRAIVGHSRSYGTIIWHGKPYRTIPVHARPYWLIHNHTKGNRLIFCHTAPYSVTLGHNWQYGAITDRIESHSIISTDSRVISSFIQHIWPHSSVQVHVR